MAKEPTEKQIAARKAFGEQARRRAAEKRLADKETEQNTNIPVEEPAKQEVKETISQEDLGAMMRYIKELEAQNFRNQNQPQSAAGPSVQGGRLTGTVEKYSTNKDKYPDPSPRLAREQRLQQFAFPINYELDYQVGTSEYTTIDNIRMKEPKFTINLNRIMMDEETGEPTNGRYTICRLIMHEDPDAAIAVARQNGLVVESDNEEEFLNEMRYLRVRDWLFECFFPPKPTDASTKKDVVIGGKLVEYFEVNSEKAATIPFGQLTTKL